MFGYVTPLIPELKVKEHVFYKSVYCGLCRSMGSVCGASRLALSYDMVFLALLRIAVTDEKMEIGKIRCGLHPFRKRPALMPSDELRYSAAVGALLIYYNLKDDISDSRGLKKLVSLSLMPTGKHIRKKAIGIDGLDALDKDIEAELSALDTVEKSRTSSPDEAADKFGKLLAAAFSCHLEEEKSRRIMYEIGYHTGRWIYLVDAADDYEKDKKTGSYNPLVLGGDNGFAEKLDTALTMELSAIENAYLLMSVSDSGVDAVIKNILYYGMPSRQKAVLYPKGTGKTDD